MASDSIIADFFQDRSVFITGSTGFVGKVLVEKLLRSCPKIKRLYLLMRTSPSKDIATRRNELINNQVNFSILNLASVIDPFKWRNCVQVFSWIDQPNVLDKIFAVAGDMTLPGLGISPSDMQLLIEDVSIVINSAASVRFDDDLKDALQTNVKGPRQLLAICQKMAKLEVCLVFSSFLSHFFCSDCKILKCKLFNFWAGFRPCFDRFQ